MRALTRSRLTMAGHAITATNDHTMQETNTKRHWAALAVARYYANEGEAARVHDLYPMTEEVFGTPDILSATLSTLSNQLDVIDHLSVAYEGKKGRTSAYYPTPITTEELRDLGEPTELPDGTPVPEDLHTEVPTDRVAAGDGVEPPTTDAPTVSWEDKGRGTGKSKTVTETTDLGEPDAVVGEKEPDDDADGEYECDCGRTFDTQQGYAGHQSGCDQEDEASDNYLDWAQPGQPFAPSPSEKPNDDGLSQEEWCDVERRLELLASQAARNDLPIIQTALMHLAERAAEGEIDPEFAQMVLRDSPFDPFSRPQDTSA